jgi:uncharacterized protein (TIGR00251 family)
MITVIAHQEGCLLSVRAQPGARKNAVVGEHNGALKVAVTAPPEDGRANDAIAGLLRKWLGLKRGQVELSGGLRSRDKQFLIRAVTVPELLALIQKDLV